MTDEPKSEETTSPEPDPVVADAAGTTAATPEPEPAPTPETEAAAPAAAPLASLGNRVLAVLIDALIAGACSIIPVIGMLVGMAYIITRDALPFLEGQSIGKKAMKLRAVSAETGKPLTNDWGPCVIRNIVLYIPFFSLVELIVLMNNKDGQRLGDQWAKTKVIVEG